MRHGFGVVFVAVALASCAADRHSVGDAPAAIVSEEIRYETTRCFGSCPAYVVTIRPDGGGTFEGSSDVAAKGLHRFQAKPEAYRRFANALAAYRPDGAERLYEPGSSLCPDAATDMPRIDVRWTAADGARRHLSFYTGCGPAEARAMRDALRSAPDALPIADLIGRSVT